MEKFIKPRRSKAALAVLLGLATVAGCSTTKGQGVYSYDGCVVERSNFELADGQVLNVGVKDMSFGSNGSNQDFVEIKRKGSQVLFESFTDESRLHINGIESGLNDQHAVTVQTEVTAQLVEEGQVVNIAMRPSGTVIDLRLDWVCG